MYELRLNCLGFAFIDFKLNKNFLYWKSFQKLPENGEAIFLFSYIARFPACLYESRKGMRGTFQARKGMRGTFQARKGMRGTFQISHIFPRIKKFINVVYILYFYLIK